MPKIKITNFFQKPERITHPQIDGLVQDCSNSIASALELLQSCVKPLRCYYAKYEAAVTKNQVRIQLQHSINVHKVYQIWKQLQSTQSWVYRYTYVRKNDFAPKIILTNLNWFESTMKFWNNTVLKIRWYKTLPGKPPEALTAEIDCFSRSVLASGPPLHLCW